MIAPNTEELLRAACDGNAAAHERLRVPPRTEHASNSYSRIHAGERLPHTTQLNVVVGLALLTVPGSRVERLRARRCSAPVRCPDGTLLESRALPKHIYQTVAGSSVLRRARNLGLAVGTVTRDNDGKFGAAFDERLAVRGVRAKRLTVASPNLQAYVERGIQSVRVECLDRFLALGELHLVLLLREYLDHFHGERPHQGLDNRPLDGRVSDDESIPRRDETRIVCRLGGVLQHFERRAA